MSFKISTVNELISCFNYLKTTTLQDKSSDIVTHNTAV